MCHRQLQSARQTLDQAIATTASLRGSTGYATCFAGRRLPDCEIAMAEVKASSSEPTPAMLAGVASYLAGQDWPARPSPAGRVSAHSRDGRSAGGLRRLEPR